jgi:hypothetical protein
LDRWIRYGLAVAWAGFALGILLWWWRRRYSTRHYSYSERATVIHDAIQQSADLGVIYWSKSEKSFLRRVITPLEMEGYTLKAFDHTAGDIRIFKVTRLKTVELVPRGSEKLPSRFATAGVVWALVGLGVVAVALLAVALYRGRGAADDAAMHLPSTNALSSSVSTARYSIATSPTTDVTSAATPDITLPDVPVPNPAPVPKATKGSQDRWEVVVYDHPTDDTNFVASALQKMLNCSAAEAGEYARQIRLRGHAAVWGGRWTQAEVLRQTLESEDIIAKVQLAAPTNSSPDSAAAK